MSGAAQAASLHFFSFSARLLPARAKQLSAARGERRDDRDRLRRRQCRRLVLAGRGTGSVG